MTDLINVTFVSHDTNTIAGLTGKVAITVTSDGKLDLAARKVNSLTRKTVEKFIAGDVFEKLGAGEAVEIPAPFGLEAEALVIVKLDRRNDVETLRKAGATLAKFLGKTGLTLVAPTLKNAEEVALGCALKSYNYNGLKTEAAAEKGALTIALTGAEETEAAWATARAIAQGVFMTRDLTNDPANVLTTTEFANRIEGLREIGLVVEILTEDKLAEMGMGSLLCVGQGSDSPSYVAVMQWNGGGEEAPFALVGKGVVFDTGGISLKPAAGMEEMTMDMGGAGVVTGVMKALALRKAKANVVGLVGLVENMPSGNATRPGDVVKSMKGDTIEVINTDAEGRLVLADVLWYAQERFKPVGMINLATLTGAIIIALGHENTGVFSNNDVLANKFLKAAADEGEGAWRLPLSKAYDKLLKSSVADMKNVGGRPAGSITAAQFLQRFVKEETPWCHLDIAGTASVKSETALAPAGATGWGVMALNRLIADNFEG